MRPPSISKELWRLAKREKKNKLGKTTVKKKPGILRRKNKKAKDETPGSTMAPKDAVPTSVKRAIIEWYCGPNSRRRGPRNKDPDTRVV